MLPFVLIISVTIFNLPSITANVAKSRDMPIQFPEPVRLTAADDEVPEACKDLTYCTVKPANYPEEKFNKMFKDYKPVPQPQLLVDLTNRFNEDDEEENCKSEVTYEPLYKVRQRRDQPWRTVIQAPGQDYVQRVRLETCSKVNAPCLKSVCSAPGFTTTCKQTYNTWEVLVSKGDNETEKIKADLPVCCSCHAETIAYMSRFADVDKH